SAHLWASATGQQIGPTLRHSSAVFALTFSPDGGSLLTGSNQAQLFVRAPDVPDDLARVANLVEVVTGMSLRPRQGSIQLLENAAWLASRDQLAQSGGQPLHFVYSQVLSEGRSGGIEWALSHIRMREALEANNSAWELATSPDSKPGDTARAVV